MPTSVQTVLSGIRPTGPLHLGHLFGALENYRRLQDAGYRCFYMIADWHALSTEYESPRRIREAVEEVALDFLTAGIDPERSTLFIQSEVPQHAELHLIFSMNVPIPWLERNPVYKEQLSEIEGKDLRTYGFLGYPVLQAADILIYKATAVPIGEDQLPHLELTREIARRFNHLYGTVFPEPQALLTQVARLPGTDGRKMSKSYGNFISLGEEPESVRTKVRGMFTDPTRIYRKDPGHPDTCPVFAYARLFEGSSSAERADACRQARIGCTDCKQEVADFVVEFLKPLREKRLALAANRTRLWEILRQGSQTARETAARTIAEVRAAMGMDYGR